MKDLVTSKHSAVRAGEKSALGHAGFFVLRTPLVSLDEFFAWSDGLAASAAGGPEQADAIAADRIRLRGWLRKRLSCPVLREALFLASASLATSIPVWLAAPESERGQKVEHALVRYFSRMASRPTPFGLFAGCSLGRIGARTELTLAPRAEYRRFTRLDQGRVAALTSTLVADPALRQHLHYSCNSTLFLGAGRWRYVESRPGASAKMTYHLVAVEPSAYLDAALASAEHGASLDTLVQVVVDSTPGVERADAEAFVSSLISSQLLCADLEPQVTGEEPLIRLRNRLRELELSHLAPAVQGVSELLSTIDRGGLGQPTETYQQLTQSLSAWPVAASTAPLVHVDLWKPVAAAQLDEALVSEVRRGVTLLTRLARSRPESGLTRFKDAFRARYDAQSVPLLRALDPECGIGFDQQQGLGDEVAALLGELTLKPHESLTPTAFSVVDGLLLQWLTTALQERAAQIEITEADLAALPASPKLPAFVAVLGAALAEVETDDAAIDPARWRFRLDAVLGPSAISLLGRFCHADPALHQQVAALAAAEQAADPEVLFAEIAHLPHGHSANIALRPPLRDYEIPLLCPAGVLPAHQLALGDLWLTLEGDQLILSSRRLQRRIVPRLGNAHNYAHPRNVNIYRFLCALQDEDRPPAPGWSWGPLAAAEYLPRVVSGRLILAPARWQLAGEPLRKIISEPELTSRFFALSELRQARRLPRLITLIEGDNALLVDLDNVLSVEAFLDQIKGRSSILIEEYLLGPGRSPVSGPEGRFANELIIPLCQSATAERFPRSAPARARSALPTVYPPGSEWLYCKLYTGMASADRVLLQCIRPLVGELLGRGAIDRWHFIRYSDPGWHLRLRFHGDPRVLETVVLRRLAEGTAPLLADGQLARMQLDTYEPEWERYGGDYGLALSEALFTADSQAALVIVGGVVGDAQAKLRWQAALVSMAGLLRDLFPDPAQRLAVVAAAQRDFATELRLDGASTQRIGARFRAERADLEALLDATDGLLRGPPVVQAVRQRSASLTTIAQQLQVAEQEGRLTSPLTLLARSYLHMTANRILRSTARPQEAIIYDFLARLYRSRVARGRRVAAGATASPQSAPGLVDL